MPHFISWQQFEDIKRERYLNEAVKRHTFQAKPRIIPELVALTAPEAPKKYFRPFKEDGYVRKTEVCKNCGRRVKVINGNFISHRIREGGKQEWCEKPLTNFTG
jgi:hypothetical protein